MQCVHIYSVSSCSAGMRGCEFAHLLKFTSNPKINTQVICSRSWTCRVVKSSSCSMREFPLRSNRATLCLLVSPCRHVSFHNIFRAMFSSFLCFLLVILLFKSTPNCSTEVLSSILKCKKAENIHVTSASQGMRCAVGCGFDVNESTMCILNKGSLNRL